jgi:glycosyltransferase involved in cell wall biosynthesis
MRIAQLAPIAEPVPPLLYGGTERVVDWLTTELRGRGHEITLFASGDSQTEATVVPVRPKALRLDAPPRFDGAAWALVGALAVLDRLDEFDVVHNHLDFAPLAVLQGASSLTPVLTTLHGRLDIDGLLPLSRRLARFPLVSISDAQRSALPEASWAATVYHGLPMDEYVPGPGRGDYFLFLGRISAEKRPHVAIHAARRAGVRLVIAAKVDEVDRDYFETEVVPLLGYPGIDFVGEVDEAGKARLLRDARGLLFPILWPEPFGLVMVESMAFGTPVITRRCGSTPEVVSHGRTGFVCDDDDALQAAIRGIDRIDRAACRRWVESRFSVGRMAAQYEAIYERLIESSGRGSRLRRAT